MLCFKLNLLLNMLTNIFHVIQVKNNLVFSVYVIHYGVLVYITPYGSDLVTYCIMFGMAAHIYNIILYVNVWVRAYRYSGD